MDGNTGGDVGTQDASGGRPMPTCLGAPTSTDGSCRMGCGFMANPGPNKFGLPYDTCCRGCGLGLRHDSNCLQLVNENLDDEQVALAYQMAEVHDDTRPTMANPPPVDVADVEIANAMQLAELQFAEKMQAAEREQHRRDELFRTSDPLWGDITLRPGGTLRTGAIFNYCKCLVFNCCPCALIGCGKDARKIWRRFLLSWSFAFAVVQVATLVAALVMDGGHVPLARNPTLGPHYHTLDFLGAKNAARILHKGEWWRLFTPILLHAGWLHLIGNLAVQLRTCAVLEVMWGHTYWFIIYVASGMYSSLASCVVSPNHLSVGSSGAICGMIGAWFSFLLITWNQTLPFDVKNRNMQTISVGFAVATILGISFLPLLDYAAHVGGLLMGAAVSMCLFASRLQSRNWRISTFACGGILIIGSVAGTFWWFLTKTQASEALLELCRPKEC